MLTVGAVHPCELLWNPSSPDFWFLRCSLVRNDRSGFDHFPVACLLSTTSKTVHLFDVFLLFSFSLVDQSCRGASFLCVSHQFLAFVMSTSRLFSTLQTATDVVHIRNDTFWWARRTSTDDRVITLLAVSAMLPTNSHMYPRPCVAVFECRFGPVRQTHCARSEDSSVLLRCLAPLLRYQACVGATRVQHFCL